MAIGRIGAAATMASPTAPNRAARPDHALAPDPVRDPRRRDDRRHRAERDEGDQRDEHEPGVLLAETHRPGKVERGELGQDGAARQDRQP